MQFSLALALDLAVVSTNGDTVAMVVPDNCRIHPINKATGVCLQMCQAMIFVPGESTKLLVEQSMNCPLLMPLVKMKLTALLTLLVQVGIGSLFCSQETQLMSLVAVEINRTLPFLWPLVPQRLSLNQGHLTSQFVHTCFGLEPRFPDL